VNPSSDTGDIGGSGGGMMRGGLCDRVNDKDVDERFIGDIGDIDGI